MKKTILIISTILITGLSFSQISMGGASTWTQVNVPTSSDLLDIDFADNNELIGFIGTSNFELLKTTNGGATWEIVNKTISPNGSITNPNQTFGAISDIEFSDENNGFMLMSVWTGGFIPPSNGLFQTTDGGNTWNELFGGGNAFSGAGATTINLSSNNELFIGSSNYNPTSGATNSIISELINTTFSTNAEFDIMSVSTPTDIDFRNDLGLASTNGIYILRTIDGGQTWDTINSGLDINTTITSIAIFDELTAYAGYVSNGMSWGLLKSEDGGLTWNQDINSATFFYPKWTSVETKGKETISAQFGTSNVDLHYPVYAGAEINASFTFGMIFESNDGINWNYIEVDEKINGIASNDFWTTNNFAGTPTALVRNTFAIGNNGYLLRNSEATGNTSISTNEEIDIQVFPNPASERITIKIEDAQQWNLTIVDANRKEINIQEVNSNQQKEVNISDLPKGLYYIILTKENQKITNSVVKF
ncbi:MAG: T9SS type A sorting domain-containing protein [Crocinitomicaceae bacterium]|nr:T9SS type A sorting domain-containing protein [Crocinitomicaceae bacterium]